MSWTILDENIDEALNTTSATLVRLAGPHRFNHRAHITHASFAKAMRKGMFEHLKNKEATIPENQLDTLKALKRLNRIDNWRTATDQTISDLKSSGTLFTTGTGQTYIGISGLPNVYFDRGRWTKLVFLTRGQKGVGNIVEKAIDYLKDKVYDKWITLYIQSTQFLDGPIRGEKGSDVEWGTGRDAPQTSHRKGSTTAEVGIEERLKVEVTEIPFYLKLPYTKVDVINNALKLTTVITKINPSKKPNIGERRWVEVDIAEKNPLLPLHDWTGKFKSLIYWAFMKELEKLAILHPEKAHEVYISTPFKQYVSRYYNAEIRKVAIKAYTGRAKITGNREISVPPRKKRKHIYKPDVVITRDVGTITVSSKGKRTVSTSLATEKGTGMQASTNKAADLARLRKYIQSRLPAEVRRNMGRPALQSRTGRFSNSVELLSLTEAKNTIMARYTYLLRPYSTFENQGSRRWPMAYNPKPIIAKSIRNLALGRIEQKLTVRRV
jgi:hypothetical protein